MIRERIEFIEHYISLLTFFRFEKDGPELEEKYIRYAVSDMAGHFFVKNNLNPGTQVSFELEKRLWTEKQIELIVDEQYKPDFFAFCEEKYYDRESFKKRIMELNPYDLVLIVSIKEVNHEEN